MFLAFISPFMASVSLPRPNDCELGPRLSPGLRYIKKNLHWLIRRVSLFTAPIFIVTQHLRREQDAAQGQFLREAHVVWIQWFFFLDLLLKQPSLT